MTRAPMVFRTYLDSSGVQRSAVVAEQLGEQLGAPATPIEDDGEASVAEKGASLVQDEGEHLHHPAFASAVMTKRGSPCASFTQ